MSEIIENRQNLYDNLIGDGYFRGDDGEINFSFDDFCVSLDDRENVETFYANLIDDGYFRDEDGSVNLSLDEFQAMVGQIHEKRDYYPITENQRGIYIDWEMNSDTTQYNIPDVQVFDNIEADVLAEAIKTVVNAHPYIKTHFSKIEEDVVQLCCDDDEILVSIENVSVEPDSAFFQKRVRPFNLLEGPLYRFEIYKSPSKIYLFMDIHHTIFDGGSSLVFSDQLQKVLGGEMIEPEKYSAFDRAQDEETFWHSEACAEAESYFDNLLSEVETTVYPRSSSDTGEAVRKTILKNVSGIDIEAFCHKNQVTASNYFLTLIMQTLHRVTREENVLITTIHHGRTNLDMMNTMGMFVKTQPVVSQLTKEKGKTTSVAKEIQNVQSQMLATQSRDIYSFTKMVERSGIRAEIMYVFQGGGERSEENEADNHISLELDTAKLPISFIVYPVGMEDYAVRLEYDGSLYNEFDMQNLIGMLCNAFTSATTADKLSDVCLLSKEEQANMVNFSKGIDLDYDITKPYIRRFVENAQRTPDALAVADEHSQYTYGQLDGLSNALAHHLVNSGACPDDFVCIMMERCKEFVLGVHAIHKVAAAYAPLDIGYPSDRLQYMIEDSGAKVLLTTHDVFDKKCEQEGLVIDSNRIKTIFIDDLELDANAEPICLATVDNLAYMIYTSGSTGKPKGTILHQAGFINSLEVVVEEQRITSEDCIGVFCSFSFDAHIVSLYPSLLAGGSVHIFPSDIRKDLDKIVAFLDEHKVTGCGFPTAIGSLIVQNYPNLSLRYIAMGGERMDGLSSENYMIINQYGPTECTCEVTYFKIEKGKVIESIPIGRPTANNWGFVTDTLDQLLPVGCAGEFCFAGVQVGKGYWHLPEKTKEVFGECPFVAHDRYGRRVRMYHTGDMVRYRKDGELEFVGRIDNQVKLRGFRIELGEIESRAMMYEGIKQAAVLVKKINGADHLCLYYSVGKDIDEEALRSYLAESLAEYMVPDAYMLMETMPMTPNGKINRKALPMPELKAPEIVPAANETEQALLDIAIELLKHDQFGVTTNLVSMGLTSILAMRMSSMIQKRLGKNISTKVVFTYPTIREIANLDVQEDLKRVSKIWEKREVYPITENQRGVYIDWEVNREALQYNVPGVRKFKGISAEQLKNALTMVVNAHPILKARLVMRDGDVMQMRRDGAEIPIMVSSLPDKADAAFFQSRIRPFDLFNDDLCRIEVYQDTSFGQESVVWLFLDIHHLVYDGFSYLIIQNDINRALAGESIAPETYTAFDRALDEKALLKSDSFKDAETYFDTLMKEFEVASYPRSSTPDTIEPNVGKEFAKLNAAEVDEFCKVNGLTPNSFFMTAATQVLHRMLREKNMLITTIHNGRVTNEMQDIVGMFVQTLPVVTKPADGSVLDAVKDMQGQYVDTQDNCIFSLTKVVSKYNCYPEIMFIYQGGITPDAISSNDQDEDCISLELDTVKMPVTINVFPAASDFCICVEYNTSLYSAHDMQQLAGAIANFSAVAAKNGYAKMSDLSILTPSEEHDVIALSTGKHMDVDTTMTFAKAFVLQAKRTPDSPVVVDARSQFTYKQMDRYSDVLAHTLIDYGVEPDNFVCVMLDRYKEFPLSVLAIHKVGAAYTPLDLEYPNERLSYMIENSQARVLITTHDVLYKKKEEGGLTLNEDIHILFIDDFDFVKAWNEDIEPVLRTTADNLAYMIYTSGSTGKPKGAMLHQAGLWNFINVVIDMEKLTSDDRIEGHRSFSFDAHIEDMYAVQTLGGSFHIMPTEIRKDLQAMHDFIIEHKITGGGYSTAIGALLLNNFNDLPVRFITAGGEKLNGVYSDHIEIINVYGPTECTVDTSYYSIKPGERIENIPIGKSVANSWNFIVDPAGHLVPQGVAGELCFAGIQVGRGYWQLPDRTAQAFCDCPFVDKDAWGRKVRMYHTGDLARYNKNGDLEFLGRIDFQVKLRGFRIELGEIESKVLGIDGIHQAAAEVMNVEGSDHLVLYYSCEDGVFISREDMEAKLIATSLAEYMVPDIYVCLKEMPLTPNGKINRRMLHKPQIERNLAMVPPTTIREQRLFNIVADHLGHTNFGVTDGLREIGMTSLIAIKIAANANMQGLVVKVDELIKANSIQALLSRNKTFVYWVEEYSEEKPILVLVQGETGYKYLTPFINSVSKKFNVLIVEAITSHFKALFAQEDITEVIEMYHAAIDMKLMFAATPPVAFVGHCFGGDLCYRLATRWVQDNSDQRPAVCLLDSFWASFEDMQRHGEELDFNRMSEPVKLMMTEALNEHDDAWDMYDKLNLTDEPIPYDGKIVLFKAVEFESMIDMVREKIDIDTQLILDETGKTDLELLKIFMPQRFVDNVAKWKSYIPTIECRYVKANHMTMLHEEHVSQYAEWLERNAIV